MDMNYCLGIKDKGDNPYVKNIERMAAHNMNFRTAIWTGGHLQMTLMSIPTCGEIGQEIHPDTDQYIRVEQGCAVVSMGKNKNRMDIAQNMHRGDVVFVPAGTWHTIVNAGRMPLKLSSIYAPPHHPKGTVHRTKEDAERAEY